MAKNKPKKPTMKEVTSTIDQMMSNMNWLKNNIEMIGNLFDLYVLFKKDDEKFKDFLEERKAKWEKEQATLKDVKEEATNEQAEDGQSNDQDSENSSTDQE